MLFISLLLSMVRFFVSHPVRLVLCLFVWAVCVSLAAYFRAMLLMFVCGTLLRAPSCICCACCRALCFLCHVFAVAVSGGGNLVGFRDELLFLMLRHRHFVLRVSSFCYADLAFANSFA